MGAFSRDRVFPDKFLLLTGGGGLRKNDKSVFSCVAD